MRLGCLGNIGLESTRVGLLHGIDKVDDPDGDVRRDDSRSSPQAGHGLYVLHTSLCLGIDGVVGIEAAVVEVGFFVVTIVLIAVWRGGRATLQPLRP